MTTETTRPPAITFFAVGLGGGALVGALLMGAAVATYPGGTVFAPSGPGSFWLNFLCDLTSAIAWNGLPNARCATLARSALAAFGVALGCFWILLPAVLGWKARAATLTRWLGLSSLGGLTLVPFTDGFGHLAAVLGSSLPALVASGLAVTAIWRLRGPSWLAATATATASVACVDAILYIRSYLTEPRAIPPALPALQKVALLGLLAWMALVVHESTRMRSP